MSGSDEDQADKPYDASPRKLEEARKKGEFVRSQDTISFVSLLAFLAVIMVVFEGVLGGIVVDIQSYVAEAVKNPRQFNSAKIAETAFGWILPLVGIVFVIPLIVIVAGLVATKQIMLTGGKLKPKLSRISIIANAKKKFGYSGIFEFFKNFLKFVIFCMIFVSFLIDVGNLFQAPVSLGGLPSVENIYSVSIRWLMYSLLAFCVFSLLDIAWQIRSHAKKNRMSHKELKDEHKNEEGDDNIRQQRRARAEEIATNRMLLDVPKAAVVITNPTHFAVALQWAGDRESVPKCVARGTDETARKIREIAVQSGVPLYRDPPTARELYASVKVGTLIDRDHYKAVAAAIGYARRIQKMTRHEK